MSISSSEPLVLKYVDLGGCVEISDIGCIAILRLTPKLRKLRLWGCKVTDRIFPYVMECLELKELILTSCNQITNEGIGLLLERGKTNASIQLSKLFASNCKLISSASLVYVHSRITKLSLIGCDLDDAGMKLIANGCQKLNNLQIGLTTKITDVGFEYITAKCSFLKTLVVSQCRGIGDSALRTISKLGSSLQCLSLREAAVSNETMRILYTTCTNLTKLNLWGSWKVGNDGIRTLHRCKKIKTVSFRGCKMIDDDGIIYLVSHAKQIVVLDISTCKVTNDSVGEIAFSLPGLKSLHLAGCDRIGDKSIRQIIDNCIYLKYIDVFACGISKEMLKELHENPKLVCYSGNNSRGV